MRTGIPSARVSEKSAKPLLQKHKTFSKVMNKLHNCNVLGKSRSYWGFSSVASPCNGRIPVRCTADPGKHLMVHSMEKGKKEQH